ncbi:MAG: sel1 repeat family protein [Bacteroidaceae bacterium]|nr:sel1 repeat family protein [Bacteroidaceae bacterium]
MKFKFAHVCFACVCLLLGCKAAEQGNAEAEAVKWYRKSAKQGDADALCNLGECYANGGAFLDYAEAVKWYRKSAE